MYYYLYKITNLVTNRYYIGVHKTKDLNDGYMGSGKIIRQAIEKYGIHNFKKEILEFFDSLNEMYTREKEIIDETILNDKKSYNLKLGGTGGWDYINKKGLNHSESSIKKLKESLKKWHLENDTSGEKNGFYGKNHKESTKTHLSQKRKQYYENGGEHPKGMLGKKHNEETKKHVSEILKEKGSMVGKKGLDHPAGGTKWYNNGLKHLRSNEHPGEGWKEGRIFKPRKRK